jgi:hypothetical protein
MTKVYFEIEQLGEKRKTKRINQRLILEQGKTDFDSFSTEI